MLPAFYIGSLKHIYFD